MAGREPQRRVEFIENQLGQAVLPGAFQRAGGMGQRAVMIGDSRTDIATARAAGIPCICVPFGYTDVPIETLAPDIVIPHFDALPGAVRRVVASTAAHP